MSTTTAPDHDVVIVGAGFSGIGVAAKLDKAGVHDYLLIEAGDGVGRLRRIADFIAGMTDRYALSEHARFFKATPELR